jgi:hypothetical protein
MTETSTGGLCPLCGQSIEETCPTCGCNAFGIGEPIQCRGQLTWDDGPKLTTGNTPILASQIGLKCVGCGVPFSANISNNECYCFVCRPKYRRKCLVCKVNYVVIEKDGHQDRLCWSCRGEKREEQEELSKRLDEERGARNQHAGDKCNHCGHILGSYAGSHGLSYHSGGNDGYCTFCDRQARADALRAEDERKKRKEVWEVRVIMITGVLLVAILFLLWLS